MITVKIDQKEFDKYLKNKQFCLNQLRTFSTWLFDYHKTGRVAFYHFILEPEEGGFMFFQANKSDEEDFNVVCYTRMKNLETGEKFLLPLWYSLEPSQDGKLMDMGFDIVGNDPEWKRLGVTKFKDLDPNVKEYLIQMAPVVLVLFAKIQTKALKTSKKVIRMISEAQELPEEKEKSSKPKKKYPQAPIFLSSGISFVIQHENSLPREFQRHCEAWMVRGHYRHYKSGKTIFIAPYKKGAGRLKDTDYSVQKGKNRKQVLPHSQAVET